MTAATLNGAQPPDRQQLCVHEPDVLLVKPAAKSSILPEAYIQSPLAGSSFVPMSLRDWRSQRAQWDGHLMVVTAGCPETARGQQLPCSGQGMRSEVRLAVLHKLLRCVADCVPDTRCCWGSANCALLGLHQFPSRHGLLSAV